MLEHVDLKQSVPKDEYKQRLQPLQERLYALQGRVYETRLPVAIVFEGWAAAGKGSSINVLASRLDPRGFRVAPIVPPRTAELAYPWMWRYWLRVPAYGQIVVYDTSWYRRVLIERLTGAVRRRQWQAAYDDIRDFESQLAADGAVLLKFWLHITKKEQKRRFKKLLASKLTAWQVTPEDLAQHKAHDAYHAAVEDMLARTEAPHAPWTIVAATDRYHTRLQIMETIVQALAFRLDTNAAPHPPGAQAPAERVSDAGPPVPPEDALPAGLAAPPEAPAEPAGLQPAVYAVAPETGTAATAAIAADAPSAPPAPADAPIGSEDNGDA